MPTPNPHGGADASPWIQRWSHLIRLHGSVLDLACGRGRHVRWFAGRGHPVVGVDNAPDALQALDDLAQGGQVRTLLVDVENAPWPLVAQGAPRQFDGVIVTNYLWRPLLPTVVSSLACGGVLLYETFAHGNASVGKPARPDFLLQPGELLQACQGLRIVAFEDGFCTRPDRFVQRIAAVREPASHTPGAGVPRYHL